MSISYRRDIDTLRSIAVLIVVFFHMKVPGFSGGFVGVDVFFVISGFLITGILINDDNKLDYSIARFYERRIRRIFPALFVVTTITLVICIILFDYIYIKELGRTVTASSLFSSNIYFWKTSDYFKNQDNNPLLHTWSLSLEEQFYIFYPLFLYIVTRKKNEFVYLWMFVLAIASLIFSIYYTPTSRNFAFYLLPTRAWELIFGGLLTSKAIPKVENVAIANWLQVSCVLCILFSVVFYSSSTPFPGVAALLPVVGAMLLIWTGNIKGTLMSRLSEVSFPVYIGKISYSLYLWHFPVISFYGYFILNRHLNALESAVIFISMLLLAHFSYKYIEQPFRGENSIIKSRLVVYSSSVIAFGLLTISGLAINQHLKSSKSLSGVNSVLYKALDSKNWHMEVEREKRAMAVANGSTPAIIGDKTAQPSFVIWGDSHAQALSPLLEELALENQVAAYVLAAGGYPPLLDVYRPTRDWDIKGFNNSVINFIKKHPEINTVILLSRWNGYEDFYSHNMKQGDHSCSEIRNEALYKTVLELRKLNRNIKILDDYPEPGFDVFRYIYLNHRFGLYGNIHFLTKQEFIKKGADFRNFLLKLQDEGLASVYTLGTNLFDENGILRIEDSGDVFFSDDNHLNSYGARLLKDDLATLFKH